MAGRPSEFSQATADIICAELAAGKGLREICAAEDMPSKTSVFRWLQTNKAFRDQYAQARETQAEVLADELVEIADDGTNDWMERNGKDGESAGWALNGEHVQRSKLRIDTRKWVLSKLLPKKYGDRVTQEISGPEGGPIKVDDMALARWLAMKLTAAAQTGEK